MKFYTCTHTHHTHRVPNPWAPTPMDLTAIPKQMYMSFADRTKMVVFKNSGVLMRSSLDQRKICDAFKL
jgi:hypothetical protein